MVEESTPGPAPVDSQATVRRIADRNIGSLYRDTAWQGVINAGITTFLPVFLVRLQASSFLVSMITSLPALVTIILSVPAASFIEGRRDLVRIVNLTRVGIRSCFLLISLVPFFLTGEAAALVPAVMVAIWGFSAVFSSATTPAWTTVIAEIVTPRRRPVVNGERWALISVVTAISVAGFGWLLDLQGLPFPVNYQVVFLLSFVAGLVSIYYFSQIRLPDLPVNAPSRKGLSPLQHLVNLRYSFASRPDFPRFLLSTFVFRLGLNLPAALYPIYWVQTLQAADMLIGLRTTAGQATLVLAYFLWGRIAGRRGHRRVLLICSVGFSLYPALTSFVRAPEWLVPVAVVWGLFVAGIEISFFEGLLESCPQNQRVSFAAVNATFANLAIFIGPLAGTALADLIGIRPAFFVATALCLLGAALFYGLAVGAQGGARMRTAG